MTEDGDRAMRVSEVAKFFSVTTYTVREWLKENERDTAHGLKGFKINGQWRALKSEVVIFAQRQYGSKS